MEPRGKRTRMTGVQGYTGALVRVSPGECPSLLPAGQLEPSRRPQGIWLGGKWRLEMPAQLKLEPEPQSSHREEVLRIWVQIHFKTLG